MPNPVLTLLLPILQVIHINDTTSVDFILIVSCSFLLNFERSCCLTLIHNCVITN